MSVGAKTKSWSSRIHDYIRGSGGVLALVCVITGVAFLLRIVNLTSIPTGLHGDEAIVGLEGQRILREILIDPYSPSALGQPTGPFYLAALTVWIWDNTVFAVRISAVIFGTLAIPALYLVVRRALDLPVALLSSTFLAVFGWHLHYSRIAFPLPAWPLWVILTSGAIVQAVRTGSRVWWAVAGAMSGAGIYVYNAHPLTLIILITFAGLYLTLQWWSGSRPVIANAALFIGAMAASLIPMLWFILNNTEMYWNSINRHSVRDTAEWQELGGPFAQAGYVLEQYGRFWWELSFAPRVDYVDATGITEVVSLPILLLALSGMVLALLRRREPIVVLGAMLVVLTPLATVLTEQGEMRRTLVIAPFLATFAAIAVVESIRVLRMRFSPLVTWFAVGGFAVVIGLGVATDLRNYFVAHGESSTQRWIFAEAFYDASVYMRDEVSEGDYVYFLSNRWSIDYEPRQFLAPDVQGENRSDEFGEFDLDFEPDRGRPVFLLLGEYRPVVDELQGTYPDGNVVTISRGEEPSVIVFSLPDNRD